MAGLIDKDHEALAHQLVALAQRAAGEVMDVYATEFEVDVKDDSSPVTLADKRAETVILDGLARLEPRVSVVAEEAYSRGERSAPGKTFFLVDPLDGTREFIKRNGEFTVNIALVVNGTPLIGVIVAPAEARTFYGWQRGSAFEVNSKGETCTIGTRAASANARIAIVSRSHRDRATDAYLSALGIVDVCVVGSSLKFCSLAAGEADFYPRFGPTCEWDIAAGHAILLAAGGNLCHLDGTAFVYGKSADKYRNPGFIAWGAGERPALPDPSLATGSP